MLGIGEVLFKWFSLMRNQISPFQVRSLAPLLRDLTTLAVTSALRIEPPRQSRSGDVGFKSVGNVITIPRF
jgi:hypothetical protein